MNRASVAYGAASSERSEFLQKRDELIAQVAENLARCLTNLNQLNRNIEAVTSVGEGFQSATSLWKQFEQVVGHSQYPPETLDENPATIHLPSRQMEGGETELLSAGAAPGGGEQAGVVDI